MSGCRVLIAEDSPLMRAWVRTALARVADTVDEAATREDFLERASGESYSLLVCPRSFDNTTGERLLSKVRGKGGDAPFLLLAPFASDRTRAHVRRNGPGAVLEDPLDGRRLADLADELTRVR